MIVKGKYNQAKIFLKEHDQGVVNQVVDLLDTKFSKDLKIRIMPDAHVGAGSVIGTTIKLKDKVIPNLVGVDIGCGLRVVKLKDRIIDFKKLDKVIRENIPSGFSIRKSRHKNSREINLDKLIIKDVVDIHRGYLSIGTLGGGNHFIEINEDKNFNKYLVIHSGSRNIGLQTALHYQDLAFKYCLENNLDVPKDLTYLENNLMQDYLHDMQIMQKFASLNRKTMADVIVEKMNLEVEEVFETVHNYIDLETMILRKGAVRANLDEKFIIPFNMADGSVIMLGKGNSEWNFSAPHGAGRKLSRMQAKRTLDYDHFKESMDHVFSTTISKAILDEAPLAYKDPNDILDLIKDTASIIERLSVVYNYKAK